MDYNDRTYLLENGGSAVLANAPQAFQDIRCYHETMEAFLASSDEERKFRLRGLRARMNPAVSEILLKTENSLLWDDYFPSELRASVLISIMSLFERCLNGVCQELAILLRTKISHTDLKGSSIERSKTFLENVCALHRPRQECWETMRCLQQLRNTVVHNGGLLETHQEMANAKKLVEKLEGLAYSEFGIDLEPRFIPFAFDEVTKFLKELSTAVEDACRQVQKFESNP